MVFLFPALVLPLLAASTEAQDGYRLTGGSTQYEGTVEVFRSGQWQTVCDDGWDSTEGNLVCRLLGYNTTVRVYSGAHFGEGAGNIWTRDWQCTGTESSLVECASGLALFCLDNEAAGVSCTPPHGQLNPTATSQPSSSSLSGLTMTIPTTGIMVTPTPIPSTEVVRSHVSPTDIIAVYTTLAVVLPLLCFAFLVTGLCLCCICKRKPVTAPDITFEPDSHLDLQSTIACDAQTVYDDVELDEWLQDITNNEDTAPSKSSTDTISSAVGYIDIGSAI